jgi:hypothetical protein
MIAPPLPFYWSNEAKAMLPLNDGIARRCAKAYGDGKVVNLAHVEDRSSASHRQYFASVNEGWQSLPEHLAERFPTAEHLRKWCLIRAGYSDSQTLVASSKAEAVKLAAFIRPIDEFSIVTVQGATVTRFTAKSQNMRAMGKADFEASKRAVLDKIAEMIGVAPADLAKAEAA